ncbi:MAG: ABC transporter permease [Gemmatimonadota bacterium]
MSGLKLAVRTLLKSPFVTAVAVLSLALGIGANAAIYSMFDEMLLRALPVEEPEELVNLSAPGPKPGSQSCNQAGDCDAVFSYPMFRDLQEAGGPFTGLAAHRLFPVNLAQSGQTQSGEGLMVSGSYFPLLGVRPALGRLLGPGDDEVVGAHFVVVLSHDYWENRLGSDPSVLNQSLIVNGQAMTVVGVAPRGFRGTTLGGDPDVFVPITMRGIMNPGFDGFENRRSYWAYVFARLRSNVTLERADSEVNTAYASIVNEVEAPLQEGMSAETLERFRQKRLVLEPGYRGQSSVHAEVQTPLAILFAVTGVVLLIACANIANLLLARGAGRAQEMAIRGSLGARRSQLLKQLLTESLLLAVLGGAASLWVAHWTLGFIASVLPTEAISTLTLALDRSVVLFAGGLSIGTGIVFGLYPAIANSRPDLQSILKAGSGQPSGARQAARFRSTLVTAQIALSTALLVPAGLFIRSLSNVSQIDLGVEAAGEVVTFQIAPELNGYESERSAALFRQVEEELAALPGVSGASAGLVPIMAGSSWGTDVSVEGFESGPDINSNSRLNEVGPGYFSTLGIPLVAGREFDASDEEGAPLVAVVNEAFTRKFNLDGAQAVGKWMSTGGSGQSELDIQIVGVVQDAKYNEVKGEVPPVFFRPYRQTGQYGFMTFYARTSVDPTTILSAIPSVVARADANLPVEDLKTLEQQVRDNVFLDRIISTLSAAFALLATVLAAIGLYGVLAYTVAQRTREIGLRMALGAGRDRVRKMVLGQMTRMLVVGGALGVVLALAVGRAAQSLLFGVEGYDPFVIAGVVALLSAIALGAAFIPAQRASRVDPMDALRYE